jgi:hypothetical protein
MFKKWNHRIAADGNHLQGVGLTPAKLGKPLAWENPLIIGILCRLAGKVDLCAAAGTCRKVKKRHGKLALVVMLSAGQWKKSRRKSNPA